MAGPVDLLPPIAAGDLATSSLPELLAAAFRTHTTGCIAVEQGAGEDRLFLRYGQVVGAQLVGGSATLSQLVVQRGLVDAATADATREAAVAAGRRHGEELVERGLLRPSQLTQLLTAQQSANVLELCRRREGRYELRGWERPPEWSDGLSLDPVRVLVEALASDELFDRRTAILERITGRWLRRSAEYDELVARMQLHPLERRALVVLAVPRQAEEIGVGLLEQDEQEAFVCALALLGLVEPDDGQAIQADGGDSGLLLVASEEEEPTAAYVPPPISAPPPAYFAPPPLSAPPPERSAIRPPVGAPAKRPVGLDGEFDFDIADEEPIELDLERAPEKIARGQREEALRRPTAPTRANPPTPPPALPVRAPVHAPEAAGRARQTTRAAGTNPFAFQLAAASRAPETRTTKDSEALGAQLAAGLDLIDARLDEVLREGSQGAARPAPRPVPAPSLDILEGIEDVVGDLHDEPASPIDFDETPSGGGVGGGHDELALQAAREAAQEDVEVEETSSHDVEDLGFDATIDEEAEAEAAPTPKAPPVERALDPEEERQKADVRRRLRQRSFMSVAGGIFHREEQAPVAAPRPAPSRAHDEETTRPEKVDVELERDIVDRLNRMAVEDHFVRLDLPRDATTEQVKEAFLALAKRYHPDRLSALGQTHLLPQVRELFSKVKESYDAIVDPAARARHAVALDTKAERKAQKSPDDARAAYQKAVAALRRRDLKAAEAELVRAVETHPMPEYLAELAWTLHSNPARRDEAKDEIRDLMARALKATPESDRAFVVAALLARAEGDADKAEKLFRRAMEVNPKNVEAARELRLIESRRPVEKKGGGLFDKLRGR